MAAVSRRLPRGLAQVRCATFISASNLERCGSNFVRTSEDKNSGASLDSRRKSKRDDGLELNGIYGSSGISPQDRCGNDFGMRHYITFVKFVSRGKPSFPSWCSIRDSKKKN